MMQCIGIKKQLYNTTVGKMV